MRHVTSGTFWVCKAGKDSWFGTKKTDFVARCSSHERCEQCRYPHFLLHSLLCVVFLFSDLQQNYNYWNQCEMAGNLRRTLSQTWYVPQVFALRFPSPSPKNGCFSFYRCNSIWFVMSTHA